MKFVWILCMVTTLQAIALEGYTQSATVNIHMQNAEIESILKEIEKQSEYRFFYDAERINFSDVADVNWNSKKVNDALTELFRKKGIAYTLIEKQIVLFPVEEVNLNSLQGITVTGTVTDAAGEPMPGVNVVIKGTTTGVVTDFSGKYTINVPDKETVLEFSFIGYATQELLLGDKSLINVSMIEQTTELEEIVVTALGIKKDVRTLGYAVQEVGSKEIEKIPGTSFTSLLSGKVAGMNVYSSPNLLQKNVIELRGRSPLIVVDGIPINSNTYDINALDVENVSVLKGATAAALYGSKGQNGAIQITTKSGKNTKGFEITFDQRSIFRAGWIVTPKVQTKYGNGEQGKYAYYDGKGNGVFDNDFIWGPELDVKDPSTPSGYWETPQWDSPIDENGKRIPTPFVSRGKNNLKNFLETGYILSNNLSISSSSEKGSFRVGLGYDYTNGEVPNTGLNNYNASITGSYNLTDQLKVSANVIFNRQYSPNFTRTTYGNTSILYCMHIWAGADVDIRDFRNYWKPGKEGYEPRYFNYSWINNPYYMAYEQLQSIVRDRTFGIASIEYDIVEGLSLVMRQSAEIISNKDEMKYPKGFIGADAINGKYELTNANAGEFNTDANLMYKKTFKKFNINALLGASVNYRTTDSQFSQTQGLKVPGIYNLSNSMGTVLSTNGLSHYLRNSVYASVDLSYINTYFLGVTARQDYSSALPESNNSYFYPSISGSVILSNLFRMPSSTFAKLRGSWAMVRADLSPYAYMTSYTPSIIYDTYNTVKYPDVLGNEQLHPQNTQGFEVGLNIKFFNNRLSFDGSFYRYVDSESIFDQPASLASGFNKYKINGNEFIRYGSEIIVDAIPVTSSNFIWNTSVNWGLYRHILNDVYGGADNLNGIKKGERMDKYLSNNTMMKTPDGQLILGANGLPVRNTYLKAVGFFKPDFTMSWNNTFTIIKDFQCSFLLEGRFGGKDQAFMSRQLWFAGAHPESIGPDREAYNRGEKYLADGVNVTGGTLERDVDGNVISDTRVFASNKYTTTYKDFIQQYYYTICGESIAYDMTFLKLREISLTYNVPSDFLRKMNLGLHSASVSLIGSNMFIITKFPMSDPDSGNGEMQSRSLHFPSPRNIGFSINVKF